MMSEAQPGTESSELDALTLAYENPGGTVRVTREYYNHGAFVREVDREEMYNYTTGGWEAVSRFTRDYALADDGTTLKGDGSNWRGTGRNWREWFTQRHRERLTFRFPHADIPDADSPELRGPRSGGDE